MILQDEPIQTDRPKKKYEGHSLMHFANLEIDWSNNLLGNLWLERRQFNLVFAPAGMGKSSWCYQASMLWSCGKTAFGIVPQIANGLRILIVQAEDSKNDMISFCQMANHLGLSDAQKSLVEKNTTVFEMNDKQGAEFFMNLDRMVQLFNPHLVIINPLNRYLGGDVKDQIKVVEFFDFLSKSMNERNFGTLVIHHTPKTNFIVKEDFRDEDFQYMYAGDATIINRARGAIYISSTETPGVFRFIGAKRGKKLGWGKFGNLTQRFFKHYDDPEFPELILWQEANLTEQAAAMKPKNTNKARILDREKVLEFIPTIDPGDRDAIRARLKAHFECGAEPIDDAIAELIDEGKMHVHEMPREKGQRGSAKKGWAKNPPPGADLEASQPDEETIRSN